MGASTGLNCPVCGEPALDTHPPPSGAVYCRACGAEPTFRQLWNACPKPRAPFLQSAELAAALKANERNNRPREPGNGD